MTTAAIRSIHRHPVKGFTPERLRSATLAAGQGFPGDRLYAVENGPSGFDADAPVFIPKTKFTVLAHIAEVARARTRYDDATGVFHASAEGMDGIAAPLGEEAGREVFARWLETLLGDEARRPLKVLRAPGDWRFMDHPQGHVSIINLASVRDLEAKIGRPVDPLRFRGNLYVDGWPAWAENDWKDRRLKIGEAEASVFKPIVRCAATHVDPSTAQRDMDVVKALFDNYGHMFCGIYVQTRVAGRIAEGDALELL
jgi:uncharacterized protein YcbX